MWFIYNLLICLYGSAIRVAALFDGKARMWVYGRRSLFRQLYSKFQIPNSKQFQNPKFKTQNSELRTQNSELASIAWFHCASLGEFEQGRPVIEEFRKEHPGWKILLTFFSPSGFEIRKHYEGADWVFYLPLDTPRNARKFIEAVNPSLAVFVKYEFWFNYLDILSRKQIPVYIISANFRPGHYFFRCYGGWARKQLRKVTRFFVQHEDSLQLLKEFGIEQVTVSGDTRFDRVAAVAESARPFPLVKKFAASKPVFLAGSTWPADEELILELMKTYGDRVKFIIAPHEVDERRIVALKSQIVSRQSSVVSRFSELTIESACAADIVIIDGIGYLSHLYQYATLAYIGGGFGAGIHNILEAAAFGKPVIFGPKYHKFREAIDLIENGGAFPIQNSQQLIHRTIELLDNPTLYQQASGICSSYIQQKKGATGIIFSRI